MTDTGLVGRYILPFGLLIRLAWISPSFFQPRL
jgi:hypothetical protein